MKRPCECNRPGCSLCRLAATDPRYQRLWELPVRPPPVAPLCGWQGKIRIKPWNYQVSLCLAHIETPDLLELALDMWQCQTIRPYILVIDTGSSWETVQKIDALRCENIEIHYLRGLAYTNSSEPVSFALDVAHARCWSPYLFHTHVDVFPKRRDLLEWYLDQCGPDCPVVGYEMSDRSWATDRWRGIPSHTATMLYMPSVDACGARWSLRHLYQNEGWPDGPTTGWPDTESVFGEHLKKSGLKIRLLGPEPNYQLQSTQWFDHARSYTGVKLSPDNKLWSRIQKYTAEAVTAARKRLRAWHKFPDTKPCNGCGKSPKVHS